MPCIPSKLAECSKNIWFARISSLLCLLFLTTPLASFIEAAKGDVPGCHNCIGKRVFQESCPAINIPTKITSKRYYLFNLHKMNWFTAHQFCTMNGMKLATVKNETENEELLALMRTGFVSNVWLGMSDLADEGKYYNVADGSPVTFTAWMPGEPNNHGGHEHCIRFMERNGWVAWNDDTCSSEHYVACDLTP